MKRKYTKRTKNAWIGFVQKNWRSVKFDYVKHADYIQPGTFVKYEYGPRGETKVIGKIGKVYEQGVEVATDYGAYYHAKWEAIARIYLPKVTAKVKDTKVRTDLDPMSRVPYFDGALNKVKNKIKLNLDLDGIEIEDRRVDMKTKFYRTMKFYFDKKNFVMMEIPNKDVDYIQVSGSNIRNAKIKCGKNGKVNVGLLINKIKQLKKD